MTKSYPQIKANSHFAMAEHFLISVDLDASSSQVGLDLRTISYLGRVHIRVTHENYHLAVSFLQKHHDELTTYCDVTALRSPKDIISLLDIGAAKVVLSYVQIRSVVEIGLEDFDRLILSFDRSLCVGEPQSAAGKLKDDLQAVVGSTPISIQVHDLDGLEFLDVMQQQSTRSKIYSNRYVVLILSCDTWNHYLRALKAGYVPIVPAGALTLDANEAQNVRPGGRPDTQSKLIPAHRLITSSIRTDRADGLFPTVVTDEHNICLGLVYSNEKSIETALKLGRGVYHSRSRNGIWIKGEESGDTQELLTIGWDCDADTLQFTVRQSGDGENGCCIPNRLGCSRVAGFCHLKDSTCFGPYAGLYRLEKTLQARKASSPAASYTARLFKNPKLLEAKILEEAGELCEALDKEDIAAEAADLFYFALTKCVAAGVSLETVEHKLDRRSLKVSRRQGDAKPLWAKKVGLNDAASDGEKDMNRFGKQEAINEAASIPKSTEDPAGTVDGRIQMRRYRTKDTDSRTLDDVLQRPSQRSTDDIMNIVKPIIQDVRNGGDAAVLNYTHKFEKATNLISPVLQAPFAPELMKLAPETAEAIDISFENIRRFHTAQKEEHVLQVQTMPGVVCSRFSRPIERVGLYVPGGTAVLPSTAMMLGVPAMVAGCKKIVLASPPRSDGTITPEIVYIANKVGAESIVLAGGAQAVAAMAYGTESIPKVDKIIGPGNQFVTAGKMIVSNDTTACVSIDMPAGPSEVLVIADNTAVPAFVASDLLSQAEHGTDSQVILIAVDLAEERLETIEAELHSQASALPRIDIVRGAIEHSITLQVGDITEAMILSNRYAPEHLILQVENAEEVVALVQNAGSVFVGPWTPESVGDYSAGVNHSLRKSLRNISLPDECFY